VHRLRLLILLAAAGLMAACATVPTGPSVAALPGSGKTYNRYADDDARCRNRAYRAAGGTSTQQAVNEQAVGSALFGTVLGAAVGGLIDGGQGAAVGAGMGLLTGAAVGANQSTASSWQLQRRYDTVYLNCMYALGNKVPMSPQQAAYMRGAAPAIPPPNAPPPQGYGAPGYAPAPPNAPAPAYTTPGRSYAAPADAAVPPPNAPPPAYAPSGRSYAAPADAAVPPPNAPPPPRY
jgi:outer membrane lipoprotein SlyB